MKKKYNVVIEETVSKTFEVIADDENQAKSIAAEKYKSALKDVKGIRFLEDMDGVHHNYSYFPIFIDAKEYGMTRDELYEKMKSQNVLGRRYFYPLITEFEPYKDYPSATAENLPVAKKMADEVICLPMYAFMADEDVDRVISVIKG